MRKIQKITAAAATAFLIAAFMLATATSFAETYTVVGFKNCTPVYNGKPVTAGVNNSDPARLKANWKDVKGSKYIKLQNTSTGEIHIISRPAAKNAKDEEGFIDWLWSCFAGQKMCSTRAPENELSGGLANNLSQTFYMLLPESDAMPSALTIASRQPEGSLLLCSYKLDGKLHEFSVPLTDGAFVITSDRFAGVSSETERTVLRLTVEYRSPDGRTVPLTDSMNVILIPE